MKFGKRLASQIEETLPEWRDKFLSYKQLKKRLKVPDCFTQAAFNASPVHEGASSSVVDLAVDELKKNSASSRSDSEEPQQQQQQQEAPEKQENGAAAKSVADESTEFTSLLEGELDKFNSFFMEKEEEYVIRLQELKECIEKIKAKAQDDADHHTELIQIRRDIVSFHGEMVLLLNYSSLNYTGLVKILKKHDKHIGTSLRLPFIQRVLHQPFFTTELLSKLVQECESNLQSVFPSEEALNSSSSPSPRSQQQQQQQEEGQEVEGIYRSTVAALQTFKELRRGSSTYSPLSLPPLSSAKV